MSGSESQRTIHVALIGVAGVGKSSIVNMLTGKESAPVNNGAKPCTTDATKYAVGTADTTYWIWDTRGLNEGKEPGKIISLTRVGQMLGFIQSDAEKELKKLLHDKNPDLVLLCIDASKIHKSAHWNIYNDIFYTSLREKMKVAVLVTRLKEKDLLEGSWKETCGATAKGVFKEFSGEIESIPEFKKQDDKEVYKDCRDRILALISKSC